MALRDSVYVLHATSVMRPRCHSPSSLSVATQTQLISHARLNVAAKRRAANDVLVPVRYVYSSILNQGSHRLRIGHHCQFEVSMVGRCSKGRRRRKRSTGEAIAGGGTHGPAASPASTEQTSSTTQNDGVNNSRVRTYKPLQTSTDSSNDADRDAIDLAIDPLLNWDDSYAGPDTTGLCANNSSMLFADRNGSTVDETFGEALDQLGIPSPADEYSTGLQMPFVGSSSSVGSANVTLPLTPYATTATPRTSENLVPSHGNRATGSFDRKACIHVLFNVMSNLEAEISDPNATIDKIMHTVKTSTKEIEHSMQSRQLQIAFVGPMLALVAIEVALILIESIVCRWTGAKPTGLDSSLSNHRNPRALLLGQYRAESDEASLIWKHVIIVELQRLLRLVEALSVYLEDSSRCQIGHRPVDHLKISCASQERKATSLIAALQRHGQAGGTENGSVF